MLTRENDEQQSSETSRRLITAASEIFARHGYAGARVRQIADAAQVNLAAVNYYFGGKEGLYRATLRFLAGQAQSLPPGNGRMRTAEERLQRRIHSILERFIGERASPLGRILAHEAMDPTENVESLLEETMRPELERINAVLKEIAGADVSDQRLTHAALGILGQCVMYLYARPALERISPSVGNCGETCSALATQITEFSLGGLERLRRASVAEK